MPVGSSASTNSGSAADNPSAKQRPVHSGPHDVNPPESEAGKQSGASMMDRVSEAQSSGYTSSASEFYGNNSDEITDTAADIATDVDVNAMKDRIKVFAESSQVLMNVLDELQKLHPVIGVAVLAFKGVVSLELKRRDNNASVLVLQVKMEEMMSEFVQLRIIKPAQKLGDGETVATSLLGMCKSIAEDIKNCGNLCDKYSKTSFCGKLFKSPVYRERFSGFIQTFETRKSELDHKLALFTAINVHSAGESLAQIQEAMKSSDEHIKTLVLLQRLQSPLEQKIWTVIEQHGGPEACMTDDKVMEELIAMVPRPTVSDTTSTAFPIVQDGQTQINSSYHGFSTPYQTYSTPYQTLSMPYSTLSTSYQNTPHPSFSAPYVYSSVYQPSSSHSSYAAPYRSSQRSRSGWGPQSPTVPSWGAPAVPAEGNNNINSHPSAVHSQQFSQTTAQSPFRPGSPEAFPFPQNRNDQPQPRSRQNSAGVGVSRQNSLGGSRQNSLGPSRQNSLGPSRRNSLGPVSLLTGLPRVSTSGVNTTHAAHTPSSPRTEPSIPPSDETAFIPRSRKMSSDMRSGGRPRPQMVSPTVATLKEEMNEDIDAGLKRNMEIFARKLHEQQRQLVALENTVIRQGDRVIFAMGQGPHKRVQDPHIRALWKEMGWKLSVPAREFVLNLHDYYVAQYSQPTQVEAYFKSPNGAAPSDPRIALKKALSLAKGKTEAKWALKLLTFQNIPKILEWFDADSSGFVSVWEVNELTSACPDGWSLLQWLAYLVVGSHLTTWEYRSKICGILQQMHNWAQAAPNKKNTQLEPNDSILPANRYAVDEYLDGISDLDLILASIQPPTEPMDTNLADLASVYVKAEEVRLEGILRMLDYEIDGPDTIALIIGRHQIERNLFPVLYILLKRHLEILHKAREVVLSRHELTSALESVKHIWESVSFRMSNLEISHLQQYNDLFAVFSNFSFGMYYRLRFGPPLYLPDVHNLWSDQDIEYHASYKDILETNAPCVNPYATTAALTAHSIYPQSAFYGCWTGHLRDHTGKITPYGMIEVFLDSDLKDGRGSYSAGTLDVSGKKVPGQDITLRIQGSPDDPIADRAFGILFQGQMQTADGQSSISGEWKNVSESGAGVLVLRQIPAWLHRLTEPSNRSPRSLIKLALSAVRYQVRLNQKGHLIPAASIMEMRRGAELSRYQYLMGDLDPFDDDEFQTILWNSTPWDARVYRSAARRSLDWTLHTNAPCERCGRAVITGTRHFCMECTTSFCEDCGGYNSAPHSEDHRFLRMHHYVTDRQFAWLWQKASEILQEASRAFFRALSPPREKIMRPTQLPDGFLPDGFLPDGFLPGGFQVLETPGEDYGRLPEEPQELREAAAVLKRTQPSVKFKDVERPGESDDENWADSREVWADPRDGSALDPRDGLALDPRYVWPDPRDPSQLLSETRPRPILRRNWTQESSRTSEQSSTEEEEEEEQIPRICIACKKNIGKRYWVCISCTAAHDYNQHVRICEPCESERRSYFLGVEFIATTHHKNHPLLRVDESRP